MDTGKIISTFAAALGVGAGGLATVHHAGFMAGQGVESGGILAAGIVFTLCGLVGLGLVVSICAHQRRPVGAEPVLKAPPRPGYNPPPVERVERPEPTPRPPRDFHTRDLGNGDFEVDPIYDTHPEPPPR